MSDIALSPVGRKAFRLPAAAIIALISAATFVGVALATGEAAQLSATGIGGLLQRMVALGIVAIGLTLVIVAGSIDLSVAHLISVSAVLAS